MAATSIAHSINRPRRKLALVIGIGEYADGQHLPNAINDAKQMSSKLKSIGFIIEGDGPNLNLTRKEMRHVLVDFEESINHGDMVVFYFAGHGRQWEDENYLIPADNIQEIIEDGVKKKINISGPELENHALNAQDILDFITKKKPFVTIFFLDCCRKYHLRHKKSTNRGELEMDGEKLGLKSMSAGVGSLMVFACAPGTVAGDGEKGERNGLFTKHLLQHIDTPNQHILMMIMDITNGVTRESKSKQIPYFNGTLTSKNIYLYEQDSHEEANDNTRVINNVSMIDNHDEAVQHHTIQSFERKTSGWSTDKTKITHAQKKIEYCGGNACHNCGRCCDWYYDGDFKRDLDFYIHNKSFNILNKNHWHLRHGARCHHQPINHHYNYHAHDYHLGNHDDNDDDSDYHLHGHYYICSCD